jgi:hypothetical protein
MTVGLLRSQLVCRPFGECHFSRRLQMKLSHVTDCYVPKARPTTSGATGSLSWWHLGFGRRDAHVSSFWVQAQHVSCAMIEQQSHVWKNLSNIPLLLHSTS